MVNADVALLNIAELSIEQLEAVVEEGHICASAGCYNAPMNGIVLCVACAYESPQLADRAVRIAKRLLETEREAMLKSPPPAKDAGLK